MNASVVQNVNLAPLSVEEMENTNGGGIFIAVGIFVVACAIISMCNPPVANAPTTSNPPKP